MQVIFYTEKGVEFNKTPVNSIKYFLNKNSKDKINFELYFYNKNFLDTFSKVEQIYLLILEIQRVKIGFEREDDDLIFRYINEDVFLVDEVNLRIENNYIVLDVNLLSNGKNRDWLEQRC